MPPSPLNYAGWKRLTLAFPDNKVITAILGICQFGARIGYHGSRHIPAIYPNLSTAQVDSYLLSDDIASALGKNQLKEYSNVPSLPNHFTASPLSLINKSDGSRRRIRHLSYRPSGPCSINRQIPEA